MGIAQNTYRCINAAIAQSLENCPVDVAFKMIVDVGNDYWIQKIPVIASSSAKVYQRIYRNSAWGSWQTFLTNADLLLLSGADQIQFDTVDQNAYFKIAHDGVVYQLSADPTGIHYDKFANNTWTNIWHMYK